MVLLLGSFLTLSYLLLVFRAPPFFAPPPLVPHPLLPLVGGRQVNARGRRLGLSMLYVALGCVPGFISFRV